MNYTEANALLTGRNQQKRKLDNNTYLERRDNGTIAVRLHQTDIIVFHPDGRTRLYSGGWRTPTTKDRINNYAPAVRIYQKDGIWYFFDGRVFDEGLTIHENGDVTGDCQQPNALKVWAKRIATFAKNYCDDLLAGNIQPSAGDCFYCQTGMQSGDCIKSHVQEDYRHARIAINAVKEFPVSPFAAAVLNNLFASDKPKGWKPADYEHGLAYRQVHSSVLRYLKRHVGLCS